MDELKFDKIVKSNLEDIAIIEYGIIEGNCFYKIWTKWFNIWL